MKLITLPYKPLSAGAKLLSEALGVTEVLKDTDFRPSEATIALNWGRGDYPLWRNRVQGFINYPNAVMNAIDKSTAFQIMDSFGVPVPQFTTDINVARGWLTNKETIAVMCREELQGRRGRGIIVARKPDEVIPAKMYTKYVKKVNEYRVHVMKGEVFYVNIKAKKKGAASGQDPLVRSEDWVLVHLDKIEWPSAEVQDAAIASVASLGLDFGGVDVGQGPEGVKVYEVNTAPELGPNTTAAYKQAFKKHYGRLKNNGNVELKSL